MASKLLDFLFGKDPDIFDQKGEVRHRLPQEKWEAWQARYLKGEEYNWRHHAGMRAKETSKNRER